MVGVALVPNQQSAPTASTFVKHTDEFQIVLSLESKKTPAHPLSDENQIKAERIAASMLAVLDVSE